MAIFTNQIAHINRGTIRQNIDVFIFISFVYGIEYQSHLERITLRYMYELLVLLAMSEVFGVAFRSLFSGFVANLFYWSLKIYKINFEQVKHESCDLRGPS